MRTEGGVAPRETREGPGGGSVLHRQSRVVTRGGGWCERESSDDVSTPKASGTGVVGAIQE